MEKSVRNKWQVRLAAVAIFLLGAAAGALAPYAYRAWHRPAERLRGRDRFEQMVERLQLNAEQEAQVRQVFGDTREQLKALHRESEPRVREIQQKADARIQTILTPEQWQRFQQLKEEMHGRGRRGRRRQPGN